MKKKITVSTLAEELIDRLNSNKTVDCCKDELINLALLAKDKIGQEMVEVSWED